MAVGMVLIGIGLMPVVFLSPIGWKNGEKNHLAAAEYMMQARLDARTVRDERRKRLELELSMESKPKNERKRYVFIFFYPYID